MPLQAQTANEVEPLRKQLKELQENFAKQQELQRQQVEVLTKQLEAIQQKQVGAVVEQQKLKEQVNSRLLEPAKYSETPPAGKPWRLTDPIRLRSGQAYMDLGLVGTFAAGGSTARDIEGGLQLGGHDPSQRGFSVQGLEANFAGAVDPYFRGNANVLFQIDREGETFVELEEAWLESQSLPGNLQLRAGQYLTEFGRHNTTHAHAWSFVDTPLVNGRLLGPDGLRNLGARLSWLLPTPFYTELFLGVQNSHGGTAASFRGAAHSHGGGEPEGIPSTFRHPDNDRGVGGVADLLFSPRLASSFELTDAQTILLGASAAFGPNNSGAGNTGSSTSTQIYGTDFTWRWKPVNHNGGFPFVAWTTEGMLRKYQAGAFDWDEGGNGGDSDANGFIDSNVLVDPITGLPAMMAQETLTDYGFYTQLLYGFKKGWVAGLRYDYVAGTRGNYEQRGLLIGDDATAAGALTTLARDDSRGNRYRVSPNLTWHPSEFSKIRLQYNYDHRSNIGTDHSIWLQFEFSLGAHAAHKF
jgi:hypothetical protein